MHIYYGVNNQVYANLNPLFGWCIYIDGAESFTALDYLPEVSSAQLKEIRTLFVDNIYPDDLRAAFDRAIAKAQAQEALALKEADARYTAMMARAEASAVAPVDVELQEMKTREQKILTRLATAFLYKGHLPHLLTNNEKMVYGLIKDGVLEFVWREKDTRGGPLGHLECPVSVKRPQDPRTHELVKAFFPIVE
jgi:hypothetical protein